MNQSKNSGEIAHSPVAQQVESNLGTHDISSSDDFKINYNCNDDADRYVSTTFKPLLANEDRGVSPTLLLNADFQTSDNHPNNNLNKPAEINLWSWSWSRKQ